MKIPRVRIGYQINKGQIRPVDMTTKGARVFVVYGPHGPSSFRHVKPDLDNILDNRLPAKTPVTFVLEDGGPPFEGTLEMAYPGWTERLVRGDLAKDSLFRDYISGRLDTWNMSNQQHYRRRLDPFSSLDRENRFRFDTLHYLQRVVRQGKASIQLDIETTGFEDTELSLRGAERKAFAQFLFLRDLGRPDMALAVGTDAHNDIVDSQELRDNKIFSMLAPYTQGAVIFLRGTRHLGFELLPLANIESPIEIYCNVGIEHISPMAQRTSLAKLNQEFPPLTRSIQLREIAFDLLMDLAQDRTVKSGQQANRIVTALRDEDIVEIPRRLHGLVGDFDAGRRALSDFLGERVPSVWLEIEPHLFGVKNA